MQYCPVVHSKNSTVLTSKVRIVLRVAAIVEKARLQRKEGERGPKREGKCKGTGSFALLIPDAVVLTPPSSQEQSSQRYSVNAARSPCGTLVALHCIAAQALGTVESPGALYCTTLGTVP